MKVYFKNLDGIRFIAAFLVLLHHAFYFKENYSPGFAIVNHMLDDAGRIGVNLFFVLSGFLISYLLFVEKDKTGTVSYRNFYIRRALRIWPLYYACGLILTFVGPFVAQQLGLQDTISTQTMMVNLLFLLFFAINIQLAFSSHVEGVFQISWSVCIEEQFYLIWPIIVNTFRKVLVKVFIIMFIVRMILRILCVVLPYFYPISEGELIVINYMLIFDKLDLFGGGMLFALLYYNREKHQRLMKAIMKPAVQVVMILLTIVYSLDLLRPPAAINFYADHVICIILFGYLLMAAIAENSVIRLETPIMKTLGRISYGIYLLHGVICQLLILVFTKFIKHPESRLIYDILYPAVCTLVTCVLSYYSYEYFEKRFLVKKKKYAVVSTRI